jgi:hypothetical protein
MVAMRSRFSYWIISFSVNASACLTGARPFEATKEGELRLLAARVFADVGDTPTFPVQLFGLLAKVSGSSVEVSDAF